MFGKETCFNCSEKQKKVNMAKTKDNFYLCRSCQSLMGRYYPGCFSSKKEEILQHLSYMEKMRYIYENFFLKDEDRITIHNAGYGISVSKKYGLFKVLDEEWGENNPSAYTELFRLDQINRYQVYNNHKENVYIGNGAFIDCGVKIWMNNTKKEDRNKYKLRRGQKTHPYVYELEIITAAEENLTPIATVESEGMNVAYEIEALLDEIFGTTREEITSSYERLSQAADEIWL